MIWLLFALVFVALAFLLDEGWVVVIAIIIFVAGNGISAKVLDADQKIECCWNVYSIEDTDATHGSFSLFGGSIDEEAVYYYYSQRADGSLGLYHTLANETRIVETDGDVHLERHYNANSNMWLSWFDGDDDLHNKWWFYVPKGSVTTAYNLNGVGQ